MKKVIFLLILTLAIGGLTACNAPQTETSTNESIANQELIEELDIIRDMEQQAVNLAEQGQFDQAAKKIEEIRGKWEEIKPDVIKAGAKYRSREFDTSLANQTSIMGTRNKDEITGTIGMGIQFIGNIITDIGG